MGSCCSRAKAGAVAAEPELAEGQTAGHDAAASEAAAAAGSSTADGKGAALPAREAANERPAAPAAPATPPAAEGKAAAAEAEAGARESGDAACARDALPGEAEAEGTGGAGDAGDAAPEPAGVRLRCPQPTDGVSTAAAGDTAPERVEARLGDPEAAAGDAAPEPAEARPRGPQPGEGAFDAAATALLAEAIEAEEWLNCSHLLTAESTAQRGRPDPNARTPDWGYSVLRAAAEGGAIDVCRHLLESAADVNATDQNAMTPLMGCVVGGDHGDIVALLLEARADFALRADDGFDALAWACRLGHQDCSKVLRAAGADGKASPF